MATFRSKHSNTEIESILDRAEVSIDKPFFLYYDKTDKMYRFFTTAERRDAWVRARDTDTMTDEINAYQFTEPFDAPAPSVIQVIGLTEVRSERCDSDGKTSGVSIDYQFKTIEEKSGDRIKESVNVIYTIENSAGTNTISVTYLVDSEHQTTSVSFNVDDYISIGANTISILIKGRTTGASKLVTVSLNVFKLTVTSTFNINQAISPRSDIRIPVIVDGSGDKTLYIYIDGIQVTTRQISQMESGALITPVIGNANGAYAPGKHTLQLQATCNGKYSDILYFEFVISGKVQKIKEDDTIEEVHQRQILIKTVISESDAGPANIVQGVLPTINGTQYSPTEIEYAFYSSDTSNEYKVQIQWEITNSDLQIQPIDMDSVEEAKVGTLRTLKVIPMDYSSETRSFSLRAKMKKTNDTTPSIIDNATYPFKVAKNSQIAETTSGLTMKLTAYGRSNNEPVASRPSWSYLKTSSEGTYNYSTSFSQNFQWSGDYGWSDNALSVKAGTWCRINNKPFATEIAPQSYTGCTFEIEFMTFDIDDDNSIVLSIGDPTSNENPSFAIYGSKAVLKSLSTSFETKFKSNERVKLAFIVYPRTDGASSYPQMVFIQVNGILSCCKMYTPSDKFNIGYNSETTNPYGMINIGSTTCQAGIKIFNIRTYNKYINMYEELNNYIIDRNSVINASSKNTMSYKIKQNDVYDEYKQLDVNKLSDQITVVQIEGNLKQIIDAKSKENVDVSLKVISPTDPAINITSPHTKISNAGQSTLGMPVPSMHVKLGAYDNNKVEDSDGKVLVGNRWSFRSTDSTKGILQNVPEKKFRLQANYMDSSGCHNGAFLNLWNKMSKKVKIGDKYVLLPPSIRKIYDTSSSGYSSIMKSIHGDNPNRTDGEWVFPYEVNMVPDSIPCIVVWKNVGEKDFQLLGQYVIMEEKKADFASGKRSIYSNIDTNGYPDPFTFKTEKDKTKIIWDNSNVRQFEIVNNVGSLTYFNSISAWDETTESGKRYKSDFEMIYPDPDDISEDGGDVEAYWNYFKNNFVKKVCDTYQNQTAFNALYCDGDSQIFDRYAWASYYCLAMRNCCVDSMVRNMEIMTFGEKNSNGKLELWLPKWWDVDMQCGLLQSGAIGGEPRSRRNARVSGVYLFAGKNAEDGTSSWLWDALEACPQFQQDVNTIDAEMYKAGWTYDNMTDIQDNNFINQWNESLFNESGLVKYVNLYTMESGVKTRRTGYEYMLQGDRTPHRHWFLKNNYGYFDALHICGDYANYVLKFTPMYAKAGCKFHLVPSEDNYYFGIMHNDTDMLYSGILGKRGVEVKDSDGNYLALKNTIGSKDTLTIYGINKLEKIDISDFGKYLNGTMDFNKTKDDVLGTVLKELYLGTTELSGINSQAIAEQPEGNATNAKEVKFDGLATMSRLEVINIRGLKTVTDISSISSQALHTIYAAGSGLISFSPKSGSSFTFLELPTSIADITMENCSLPNTINWYKTNTTHRTWTDIETQQTITEESYYVTENKNSGGVFVPSPDLHSINFTAMGDDVGAKALVLNWLHSVRDDAIAGKTTEAEKESALTAAFSNKSLTFTDVQWNGIDYDDLMLIARIPSGDRNLKGGYFLCNQSLTTAQMNTLMSKFGDYIFTDNSLLMIDSNSTVIKITVTGNDATITESPTGGIPTIELLQGNTYNLGGVVFPVKRQNKDSIDFTWSFGLKNSDGIYTPHTSDTFVSNIQPLKLDTRTGELIVYENSTAAITGDILKINVGAIVDGESKNGSAFMCVKRRVYPEDVVIHKPDNLESMEGVVQILNSDSYTFSAEHSNPSDYNGNLSSTNGGVWELSGYNSTYMGQSNTDTTYTFTLNSDFESHILEEKSLKLKYTSHWMDATKSCSAELPITIISVIKEVLSEPTTYGGNRALYYSFYDNRNGITRTGTRAGYSSLDLKRGTGVLNFKDIIESLPSEQVTLDQFTTMNSRGASGTYNIAKYLKNISDLNLNGCYKFSDDLNVVGMNALTSVNMSGTFSGATANIGESTWLKELTYGTPRYVDITNPKFLMSTTCKVENTSLIEYVKLSHLQDKKEMTMFVELMNNRNGTGTATLLPSLTSVEIDSNSSAESPDNLGDSGKALEQLSELITSRNLSSNTSHINSTVKMKRIYNDTKNSVCQTLPGLNILNDEYYRRWNDRNFEIVISDTSKGLGGDGTGLTLAQALTSYTLKGAIKGNNSIKNLSDLHYFGNLTMEPYDSEANSDFSDCNNIASVSIPSSVSYIGKNTFVDKAELSSIDFSHANNLVSIHDGAFRRCTSSNLNILFGTYTDGRNVLHNICPKLKYADITGFTQLSSLNVVNSASLTGITI